MESIDKIEQMLLERKALAEKLSIANTDVRQYDSNLLDFLKKTEKEVYAYLHLSRGFSSYQYLLNFLSHVDFDKFKFDLDLLQIKFGEFCPLTISYWDDNYHVSVHVHFLVRGLAESTLSKIRSEFKSELDIKIEPR